MCYTPYIFKIDMDSIEYINTDDGFRNMDRCTVQYKL